MTELELCTAAIAAMKNAYVPYSGFRVGAALLCSRLLHVSLWGWVAPAAIAAVGVSIVADAFRGDNGDKGDKNEKKGDGEDDKTDAEIKN